MLHSLPALLDDLERRLIAGEDPLPLLGSVRWPDLGGWPKDLGEVQRMNRRLSSIQSLVIGLQAPVQAALRVFSESSGYGVRGTVPLPTSLSLRFSEHV